MTAGSFIVSVVERKPSGRALSLVDTISLRLDSLTTAFLGGTRMAREAIVDLLKFVFNILTHYPKVYFVITLISLPLSHPFQLVDCEKVSEAGSSNDSAKVMGEYWTDRLDGFV